MRQRRKGRGQATQSLCVLWGPDSALSELCSPQLSQKWFFWMASQVPLAGLSPAPPLHTHTLAVFDTEGCSSYMQVQPKTPQAYGFCLCLTLAHPHRLEHLPSRPLGPLLTVALSVYTQGANTERFGLMQQYSCFSAKADAQKYQGQEGFRFNDSRNQV